jgi:N-acetylglucosamine-6-phosphate deacetylase
MSWVFVGGCALVGGELRQGLSVAVEGERIRALGRDADRLGRRRQRPLRRVDLDGAVLAPGFVDLHTHGAAGVDFYLAEGAELERALRQHYLPQGVTRLLVSICPGPWDELLAALRRIAAALEAGHGLGVAAGIHLEGPFLDPAHPGALPGAHFRDYSPELLEALLAAGGGWVRTMTLAPERPGGMELLAHLRRRRVVGAFGHSGADFAATRAAIGKGLHYVTHLFNAMDGIHHRQPGPVPAILADPRVRAEVIGDGIHLDREILRWLGRLLPPERLCLVSDSVAPCGLSDGDYLFAGERVRLSEGRVTLANGRLAGSALTMAEAFRYQVEEIGAAPALASISASTTPAAVAGWSRTTGEIAVGKRADLVALDRRWRPLATWVAGKLAHQAARWSGLAPGGEDEAA